ncbi:MAG: hypothetical protein D4R64_16270 [Porphyromonadaceae bacterium]|nr:MAG: hypothetical protein D4R64_16270 [Porphyromonadaceae bacterium]
MRIFLLICGLAISSAGFSQSGILYTLFHNPTGLTVGTLNNADDTYVALSETFCFSAFCSTLDPVNGQLIF